MRVNIFFSKKRILFKTKKNLNLISCFARSCSPGLAAAMLEKVIKLHVTKQDGG